MRDFGRRGVIGLFGAAAAWPLAVETGYSPTTRLMLAMIACLHR